MPPRRRSRLLLALRILCPAVLVPWLLWYCLPASAQDTLTYVAQEIENHFSVRQFFDAGLAVSDFTTPNADSGTQFPFVATYDPTTAISASTPVLQVATTGAIADPTVAPILSTSSGGALPADTYHIKYLWLSRFGDGPNGSTSGTTSILATTLLSPETVVAVGGGTNQITMTLPTDYPAGAIGFAAYCDRNGDAILVFRLCSTITLAPNTTKVINAAAFLANSLPTTNNTVDMMNFATYGQGWNRFGFPSGIVDSFLMRFGQSTGAQGLLHLGPTFDYSHDGGSTVYSLRDPKRAIPVCGTSVSVSTALAAMDDTTLPIPTAAQPVTLIQVGPCSTASVTWKSHLNFIGPGRGGGDASGTLTIDVSSVTDASFSGLDGAFKVAGSGASRILFHDMHVEMEAGTRLTSSEDIVFDGVRTYVRLSAADECGSIRISGGSYTIRGSDFTCRGTVSFPALGNPTVAIEIGNETGAGVATPITYVSIVGNVMAHTPRTGTNYNGFIRGWFDTTATASTVSISGNSIDLDNGEANDCIENAPGNGSLMAFNTGLVDAGVGRVVVRSSGNTYRLRSCQKAIIWRTTQLDQAYGEPMITSVGDNMYAETTGTGATGTGDEVDEDAHCFEGATGSGNTIFAAGSCLVVNNNGEARPFYMHQGCCVAGTKPQVYITDYDIQARSTSGSPAQGWAIRNDCDTNSGCDIWVSNVTIHKTMTSLASWDDIAVGAAATAVGSTIVVRDVDYDPSDISGVIRTWRGLNAMATAPTVCTIGDTYTDTSGGYCVCTALNTWTNISGVGNCT